MARIAIVGPGAIGLTVGAALMEGPHSVVFCGRHIFDDVAVTYGADTLRLQATVITDESKAQPVDWVLFCVKAHMTESASGWIRPLAAANVAVLRNGVEHMEAMRPYVPTETRIVPVVVWIPANRTGPGEAAAGAKPRLVAADDAGGCDFKNLFAGTRVTAETTNDFVTEAWDKLCVNAPGGAITALTERLFPDMRTPLIEELARQIVAECVAVGRAEGAKLDESLPLRYAQRILNSTGSNSMYGDRLAGLPLEFEARNAVIVRLGAKHGIRTPVNAALVALLSVVSAK